jgi:hypothetical protein
MVFICHVFLMGPVNSKGLSFEKSNKNIHHCDWFDNDYFVDGYSMVF